MRRSPVILLLAALAGAASPLAAQTAVPPANRQLGADRTQVLDCLRQSGSSAAASCIGLVAIACVRAAGADRRAAESDCARREEAVWRERLTVAGQVILRGLDDGRRARFASLNLAWEGYVAQKCAFYATQQPDALQPGRQAGCELREVARRAIELERSLPRPQAASPPSRPQIFR